MTRRVLQRVEQCRPPSGAPDDGGDACTTRIEHEEAGIRIRPGETGGHELSDAGAFVASIDHCPWCGGRL